MVGVDDLSGARFKLIPRLPSTMTAIEVKDVPVTVNGEVSRISFRYARDKKGDIAVTDGNITYSLTITADRKPEYVRFGPFTGNDIRTNGRLLKVAGIQNAYYAYVAF